MARYYFSGIDRASFIDLLAREGAAGMVNAAIATQPAMLAAYKRWPEVRLVLDSGAFQGATDLVWYASVAHDVRQRFDWVANLDVIGNQDASDKNWHRLRDEMDVEALWIYQVEGGTSLDYLAEMARQLRFVGIGGLVPVIKRDIDEGRQLIAAIGACLAPWAKGHFFGICAPQILAEFGPQAWFASADSQVWLVGFKARELLTRSGQRLKSEQLGLELNRDECAAQNVRQVHVWLSGQPMQFSLLSASV